ncbi:KilA-N domain-containing protein [Roseibium aggregatum]|jgi:hypothetical protein|uniref:KilA-N domain-containing protein n=1 Tax=Roseibium aggregatum TaxID=187304 RepID=UPI001E32D1AF|nr:KilA-N domain-containing protein [Roseibium aggregatum]UES51561.1 hypothetical protein GFK88_19255 [Roseibium aggregatum]
MTTEALPIKIRGKKIQIDENGLVCLNDIWEAAGFSKNQKPSDWTRLSSTRKLIEAVLTKATGKSRSWSKSDFKSVLCVKNGVGTFADPRIALAYSEYLNPKLALEVREVFLRYKSADPTLADEVLERATDLENEWAATRALARVKRNEYTKTLDEHGVEGFGYANCTNAVYGQLFDATAKKLKEQKSLPKNGNLRNAMTKDELVYIMMAETLAKGRIEEEKPSGNGQCTKATKRSASFVREAIEADKKDRQRPLV